MKKLKHLTKEEELEIIEKFKHKFMRKDIISEYGISDRHYTDIILKYGLKLNGRSRRNEFNEDYFENINTEDKAYFLGFIVADGCVQKNYFRIIQKETEILYDFKKYIRFTGNIFTSKSKNISTISMSSNKTICDLNKLGIHSNKTMVIKYPIIPRNLENHFMRGVFDGDGCVSIHKDRRNYNAGRGQVNI